MLQKIKIYTEDVGNVENLTAKYFPGFTSIHCAGFYEGKKEHSVIIEIVESFKDNAVLLHACNRLLEDILFINEQNDVLVDINGTHHCFVSTSKDFILAWTRYIGVTSK